MDHLLAQLENDHRRLLRLMYLLNRELDKLSGFESGSRNTDQIMDILDYIQTYPEVWHHPVEDILFRHLMAKPSVNLQAIEALLLEHTRLEAMSKQIVLLMGDFRVAGLAPSPRLVRMLRQYYAEQMSHIHAERNVFALMEALFEEEDWRTINQQVRQQLATRANDEQQWDYIERCEPITGSHILTNAGLH